MSIKGRHIGVVFAVAVMVALVVSESKGAFGATKVSQTVSLVLAVQSEPDCTFKPKGVVVTIVCDMHRPEWFSTAGTTRADILVRWTLNCGPNGSFSGKSTAKEKEEGFDWFFAVPVNGATAPKAAKAMASSDFCTSTSVVRVSDTDLALGLYAKVRYRTPTGKSTYTVAWYRK